MAKWVIETYFDYASPFAYLASQPLEEIAARHNAIVDWRPIRRNRLPSFVDGDPYSVGKRKYLLMDARRAAVMAGIPIQPPHPYPVRSDLALQLALVCQETDLFPAFHRAVFEAAWAQQRDISNRKVLESCIEAAGGDPKPLLDRCKASTMKAQLIALQVDAESRGIFGVPAMMLHGELFWGADRLPALEWRLEELERKAGLAS